MIEWAGTSLNRMLHITTIKPLIVLRVPGISAESQGEAEKGQVTAKGWACDVASEESVQKVFTEIEKEYGRIDVSGRELIEGTCGSYETDE